MSWFEPIAELTHAIWDSDTCEVVVPADKPLELRWNNGPERKTGFSADAWIEAQVLTSSADRDVDLADWVGSAAVVPVTSPWANHGWLIVASESSTTFTADSLVQLKKIAALVESHLDGALVTRELDRLGELLHESERALADTQARLEISNQELEQFAYIAAHELVAPLRSVAVYAEVLETLTSDAADADQAPDQLSNCVSEIRQGVQDMTGQVQYLLALSRAEQVLGTLDLVDTTRTAYAALDTLTELLEDAGATVAIDPLPAVLAHDIPLQSVFANLITNSVRYRDRSRPLKVKIQATYESDGVNIEVSDNAAGITPEAQTRIFALFERDSTDRDGLGVGLAVSRRILEGFGASISVRSSAGEGSTFVLNFPQPSV